MNKIADIVEESEQSSFPRRRIGRVFPLVLFMTADESFFPERNESECGGKREKKACIGQGFGRNCNNYGSGCKKRKQGIVFTSDTVSEKKYKHHDSRTDDRRRESGKKHHKDYQYRTEYKANGSRYFKETEKKQKASDKYREVKSAYRQDV